MIGERLRSGPRAGVCAVLLLQACASVDFDHPRTESFAYEDTEDTALGRALDELPHAGPGESGFYLLSDGVDALAARIKLADAAERCIDLQYYLIHPGPSTTLFFDALLRAADRGVRVRLLLDDFVTSGLDDGLRALDVHPEVEVRLFNPVAYRRFRLFNLPSLARVNRRMHNKSFTVDNQATVIGGRNIADEYFGAREDLNFGDLDVFAVGPIVREVSALFDEYWNFDRALPLPAVVDAADEAALEELRAQLSAGAAEAAASRYGEVLVSVILETLEDEANLTWCPYELVYDSPDKADASRAAQAESIVGPLAAAIEAAREEVFVVSPYFVPRPDTSRGACALVARGVETVVVTNGLASNNQVAVHSGYAPSRRPLLECGVELWEVRADVAVEGTERVGLERSRATLHTKSFAIDRERLFIGSFNFDPRSADLNTEMGVILDAPEMTRVVVEEVRALLPERAYRLSLDANRGLLWTTWEDGAEVVYRHEPDSGLWRRFTACVMGLLPIRGQL